MDGRRAVPRGREQNSRERRRRMRGRRWARKLLQAITWGGGGRDGTGRNENLSEATGTASRLGWGKVGPNGEGGRGHAGMFLSASRLDESCLHGRGVPAEGLAGSIRR